MATSTLIQSLNAGDAFPSNRRCVETFLAGAAIAAGDFVAFDLSQTNDADKTLYVVPCNSAAPATKLAIGVAIAVDANTGKVDVVLSGFAAGAKVNAAVVAGDNLDADATAGQAAGSAHEGIAYAVTGAVGGAADVIVKRRF